MKVKVELITPKIAANILNTNAGHNRPLDKVHAEFLTRQMKEGAWIDNGEAIQLDTTGKLCNGQHRLHAIVNSGTTQKVVVVREVSAAAFKTIDVDRKPRGLATVLQLEGYSNYTHLAAGIGIINRFLPTGDFCDTIQRLSTTEAEDILLQFPELPEWASIINSKTHFRATCPCAASFLLGCGVVFGRSIWGRVSPVEFTKSIGSGEGLVHGDPALTLRNRLLRIRMSGGTPGRRETIMMIIRAWNATQEGRKMRSITSQAQLQRVRKLPPDWADESNSAKPE